LLQALRRNMSGVAWPVEENVLLSAVTAKQKRFAGYRGRLARLCTPRRHLAMATSTLVGVI